MKRFQRYLDGYEMPEKKKIKQQQQGDIKGPVVDKKEDDKAKSSSSTTGKPIDPMADTIVGGPHLIV
jgi:hypothetical protein